MHYARSFLTCVVTLHFCVRSDRTRDSYADLYVNGFDSICTEALEGKQNDKLACKTLNTIADSQAAFAYKFKQLSNARSNAFADSTKIGMVNDGWVTFKTGLLGMMSQNYEKDAKALKGAASALKVTYKDQSKKRKMLLKKGQIVLSDYARTNQKHIHAREEYEKAVNDAENIIRTVEDDDERVANAIRDVDNAFFAMKDAAKMRRLGQDKYKEHMQEILQELEHLQSDRYKTWSMIHRQMTTDKEKMYDTIQMLLDGTQKAIEKIDASYDTDLFLKRNPPPKTMEPLPEPCAPLEMMPKDVYIELFPKSSKSSENSRFETIRVDVPRGAKPGQKVRISHRGLVFDVAVPADAALRGCGTFPVKIPRVAAKSPVETARKSQGGVQRHRSKGKEMLLKALSPSSSKKNVDGEDGDAAVAVLSQTELLKKLRHRQSSRTVYAVATKNFVGAAADELSFRKGDQITILNEDTGVKGVWHGSLNGLTGYFPKTHIQVVANSERPLPSLPPRDSATAPPLPRRTSSADVPEGWTLYKAEYDFDRTCDEEISFKTGDLLLVEKKSVEESKQTTEGDIFWWMACPYSRRGVVQSKKGFVPSNYLTKEG